MEEKIQKSVPIYMESILSASEYKECAKKYPNTYSRDTYRGVTEFAPNGFKCRYKMGVGLTTEEIVHFNKQVEKLKEYLKEKAKQDWDTTF